MTVVLVHGGPWEDMDAQQFWVRWWPVRRSCRRARSRHGSRSPYLDALVTALVDWVGRPAARTP
jgi:hypothetical protein